MSDLGFKAGAPVVQVKSIIDEATGFTVVIQCCYCFEEHGHGSGVDLAEGIPDGLGHRVTHCGGSSDPVLGSWHGYNISTVAWKLAERTMAKRKKCKVIQ